MISTLVDFSQLKSINLLRISTLVIFQWNLRKRIVTCITETKLSTEVIHDRACQSI
jgi:hypothetical protein